MKKRKIFYFLKTKEEYDYMLTNKLIPKRGIVFIQSTQEIYKNNLPYSGYSPLKSYFDQLKLDLLTEIQERVDALSSVIGEMDTKLLEDVLNYNGRNKENLDELLIQITENKSDLTSLLYYVNNTLVPSLTEIRSDVDDLSSRYTQILTKVNQSNNLVTQHLTTLNSIITNISELKTYYNNEISSIHDTILGIGTSSSSSSTNTLTEDRVKVISKLLLDDNDFRVKVLSITSSIKSELLSQISGMLSGITVTDNGNTISITELFNTVTATTSRFGSVKIGDYLKLDSNDKLTIDIESLLTALDITPLENNNSENNVIGEIDSSTITQLQADVNLLKAYINDTEITSIVANKVNSYLSTNGLGLAGNEYFTSLHFSNIIYNIVKGILQDYGYVTMNNEVPTGLSLLM